MGKQKRARSAAIPPVHNAHLVLPSALELHMAPINLACVVHASTSRRLHSRCPQEQSAHPGFALAHSSSVGNSAPPADPSPVM